MEKANQMKEEEKVFRYKGILYPILRCPEENLKAYESFEARPDDIMLVAYPKCGFNWMVGVMLKIMAAAKAGNKEIKDSLVPILEFFDPEKQKSLSEVPSPRLLGTHMHPDNIPPSFAAQKTKILVIFRNPKDTMVSYYHFTNSNPVLPTAESWDKFYEEFMRGDVPWGSYFDNALAWEKRMDDPDVMIVTFEEMKRDLTEGIRRISNFFGFTLSEEQVQTISQESMFNAMKDGNKEKYGKIINVIFRKGEVGDWKNHFSESQSQEMDVEFEKRLAGTKLGALLKYDTYCK
ncbi:sulfotransferase 6B1-like [Scleropages formosus]|uniref:sulfotransferase 6B1-like n=1 Tax=Scleropages formosus TaxID=113540 RepID=UPI0010FA996C|nr:sulfotransferase 6B1-like [Scleropages formosus]